MSELQNIFRIIEKFEKVECNIKGKNIDYYIYGDGRPCVIVPGFRSNIIRYAGLVEILSEYFKVYAPELPGIGTTEKLHEGKHSIKDYGKVMSDFVSHLNLKDYVIIGFSLGGPILVDMLTYGCPKPISAVFYEGITREEYTIVAKPLKIFSRIVYKVAKHTNLILHLYNKITSNRLILSMYYKYYSKEKTSIKEIVDYQLGLLKIANLDVAFDLGMEVMELDLLRDYNSSDINAVLVYTLGKNNLIDAEATLKDMEILFPNNEVVRINIPYHSPVGPTTVEFVNKFIDPVLPILEKYKQY